MSNLDQLIVELCPDGVEYKTLGDIAQRVYSGGTPLANRSDYYGGDIPWLRTQEVRFVDIHGTAVKITPAALENSAAKWIPEHCVIIAISGATAGRSAINKIPLTTNQHCCCLEINPQIAVYRYVFHWVYSQYENIKALGQGARSDLNSGIIKNYHIPLPPLTVQQEIVRILDNFTELTEELTAELTARKKQYQYYRNELLTFGDDVPVVTLGDIAIKVYSGGTPLANHPEYYGGDIPWLRTQEVRFVDIIDTEMRITPAALANSAVKWIPANCVIVAISGATAGRSAINKIPLTTNQHCCCFEINPHKADYRYVFYWVSSQYEKLKALGQGARADLNSGIIKSYPIALPSLDEQARIVAILDRFDTLTADITIGLPAEIEARRNQYEYYRDKLLTFKEKAA